VWAAADYYATLGVQRSADIKAIKAAYRKLARQVLDACPLQLFYSIHWPICPFLLDRIVP
jgi:hypothetical protein